MPTKKRIIIPAFIASPLPFRLVIRSQKDNWNPTIENINNHTYDYVRLHRISGTIDIGLQKPYTLAVTFDGSFILPAIKKYEDIVIAVDEFNNFFGSLLLGGVFTQSVDATFLQRCVVYKNYYFETIYPTINSYVELKNAFRHKHSSVKDNIVLLDSSFIMLADLIAAYRKGNAYLEKVKNLSPSVLIKGTTSFINNSYSESLINNWLSIEQILDHFWQIKVLRDVKKDDIIGRTDFLKDNRTWTSASKSELLFQKGIINAELYNLVSIARKARNNFIHTGKNPLKTDSEHAFNALFALLSLAVTEETSTSVFDETIEKYKRLDPIKRNFYDQKPTKFKVEEVDYWLDAPIPPIPGSEKWDAKNYDYDVGFDFDN